MSLRGLPLLVFALVSFAPPALQADDAPSSLPLGKVVLFNSGVGFFQHEADVVGDQSIDLKFNVDDINDLLKSMVLQDLGGGKVSTVTYGSQDPITKTLKTFAIDLTSNPTLFDLLAQVRGEKVQVETPSQIVGTILGLERRKQKAGDDVIETEYLNLLTDEGIRSFPLSSLSKIKLVNEKLDSELRQALTVLALGHATDKKTVSLKFLGQGKRPVRVGYIQNAPIWKTSYRLVLKDRDPPFLQGWAIVENTTEADWKDVNLTLVSGRPISFVMNLYQPLYVPRPMVEPELFASLRPQTYGQDMDRANVEFAKRAEQSNRQRELAATDSLRKAAAGQAPAPPMAAAKESLARADAQNFRGGLGADKLAEKQQLELKSVASVADAGNVGEFFQYVIDTPVSLPRQQSAMLPIVNASVQGEKVSIYNPAVHAKHPLSGLRLTNTSGLHLMQGPITVFDDGAYAGDARIEDLQPNTVRLISYAMDLDTEVAVEGKGSPDELTSVRIAKGTLIVSRRLERQQIYTVKNSSQKIKQVLIEQPLQSNWKLLEPEKPSETTRDLYRFAVTAEPGKPLKLPVREEQIVQQQIAANNLDSNSIQIYVSAKTVSDSVKSTLREIVERKRKIEQITAQIQQYEAQVKVIEQEQARIRQNMQQLERNSDLYSRYVKKFGEQEDEVERLRLQIKSEQDAVAAARRDFDTFLLGLDVK